MEQKIYFGDKEKNNVDYIVLENNIPYDWDDYGVAADILYNISEKKVIVDFYGHGSDCLSNENNSIKYSELKKNNFLNINFKEIAIALINNLNLMDYGLSYLNLSNIDEINIPCKVVGGRNKTNNGILLKVYTPNDYLCSRFNKEKAVVYFKDKNEIIEVSPSYLNLAQSEENNKLWLNNILNYTLENLLSVAHLIAYRISYSACDSRHYRNGIFKVLYINRITENVDTTNISYPKQTTRQTKFNAFKEKKMNDLKAWADNKFPDKTENEKLDICEKVFKKYYSNKD